jgi:molecular chaperone GrpE
MRGLWNMHNRCFAKNNKADEAETEGKATPTNGDKEDATKQKNEKANTNNKKAEDTSSSSSDEDNESRSGLSKEDVKQIKKLISE